MKIAAAQIAVSLDVLENSAKIIEYIAKAKKADVICFPELSLQCDESNVKPIGKEITKIAAAARKYNMNVIFGAYVKEVSKIKNRIFVMDRTGKIIHRYNKRNPYATERSFLTSGKMNKVFLIDNIPCATINCWDYAFPEYLRTLAKSGAVVFFCPAYLMSFPLTHNVLRKIPQVRAFDTMSYFIMVDAFTTETYGRSRICHPLRQLAFVKDKEKIIYADVSLSEILELRAKFNNF